MYFQVVYFGGFIDALFWYVGQSIIYFIEKANLAKRKKKIWLFVKNVNLTHDID